MLIASIGPNFAGMGSSSRINNEQTAVRIALDKIFPNSTTYIVNSDRFMDQSAKENYDAAWIAREVVQNFIDHNPNRQTLNGVIFREEELANNVSRFTIEGDWPFHENTGLTTGYSAGKGEHSAGGNGIGLKQAALLLLREANTRSQGFGAQAFQISGDGWALDYTILSQEDLQKHLPASKFQFTSGWLVAKENKTDPSDRCTYTIETNNSALKDALRAMPDMGVHSDNPYLKNMDYQSTDVGFKWLGEQENGRIYLNGQVMKFNNKKTDSQESWDTLPGLTISLNQEYKITLDRKPFDKYDLKNLLRPAVQEMSTKSIIEQLKKSKELWTSPTALENDNSGALILVELMADSLAWRSDYSKESALEIFGEHYHKDYSISGSQIADLRKEGKSIVPAYLRVLGFPEASSLIDKTEKIRSESVAAKSSYEITRAAKDGVIVSSIKPNLESKSSEAFFTAFQEFLQAYDYKMDDTDTARTKITVNLPDIESVLISHPLNNFNENKLEQVFLLKLRGFIEEGLKQGYLSDKDLLIADKDYVYKFGLNRDHITGCEQLILKAYDENTDMYRKSIADEQILIDLGIKALELNSDSSLEKINSNLQPEISLPETNIENTGNTELNSLQSKNSEETKEKSGLGTLLTIGALVTTVIMGMFTAPSWLPKFSNAPSSDTPKEALKHDHANSRSQENTKLNDFLKNNNIPSITNADEISQNLDNLISSQTSPNVRLSTIQPETDYTGEVPGHNGHTVENLELQTKTESETKKIEILSKYIKLSTGIEINPDAILVYTGDGALGLNWNKCSSIGLHRETLKEDFYAALKVMNHELAHCASNSSGHDLKFRHANEALAIAQLKHAMQMGESDNLSLDRKAFFDLKKLYNSL